MRRCQARLGHGGLGRGGTAAIEFAIAMSFLSLTLVAAYDFGRASWTRMQVVAAAHIGAAFAAAHGFNPNLIGGAVAASSALPSLTANPAPAQVCGCPSGTGGLALVECGTACSGGGGAGTYVRVTARGTYSFVFPYPGISNPLVVSATALTRIQ